MNCDHVSNSNPVERFVGCFGSVGKAAAAAGVSTEMLRRMRRAGFVSARERAIHMATACGERVTAAELLALNTPAVAA